MIKNRRGIWKLLGQAVSNCSSNFHHAFWETKNKRFFNETRFLILDSCRGDPYYLASGLKATIHLPCHAGDETLQTPPLVNMLHSMQLELADVVELPDVVEFADVVELADAVAVAEVHQLQAGADGR